VQEFSFRGLYARGLGDGSPHVGVRGEAPVGGLEKKSPEAKQFRDIDYRFSIQKRSKFDNFAQFT